MTGYERCLATIEGRATDRVPAYTPTIAGDVASQILGRPAHTGGPGLWYEEAVAWSMGRTAWEEFDGQIMEDTIALNRELGMDVIRFPWRKNIRPTRQLDEWTFLCGEPDGAHVVWHWDAEAMNFLSAGGRCGPDVEAWPELARRARESVADKVAEARATVGQREARLQERVGDTMLAIGCAAMLNLGLDEAELIAPLVEPGAVEDILDCELEIGLAQLEACAAHGVKVVLGGGDMADKNGPIYSPELFERFMLPRWKKIADRARELGIHYVWRSDGNLWKVTDMLFLEAGLPGYGEIDHDAGMTAARVREKYPELVLWGNLSGDLLRRGTVDEVYRHSIELLEASGGRRYFHGCSNTILPGTPPGNVRAMLRARDEFDVRTNGDVNS
jgi:hypothetical protein